MALTSYTDSQQRCLLQTAASSIRHGLAAGTPLSPDLADCDTALTAQRASFVTLEKHGQLRGCIGSLTATQPLLQDVAQHAFASAFQDPRFPPVGTDEVDELDISISVLTEPTPIAFTDEVDLLQQLRPGEDGLILETPDGRLGTFLPAVWEQVSSASEFLRHLKVKMGLNPAAWPENISAKRYAAISVKGG